MCIYIDIKIYTVNIKVVGNIACGIDWKYSAEGPSFSVKYKIVEKRTKQTKA